MGRAYREPEPRCLVCIPGSSEEAVARPGVYPNPWGGCHRGAGDPRRERDGHEPLWDGRAAGVVGRALSRQQRECGQAAAGPRTAGESISPASLGAMCLGGAANADVSWAHLPPSRRVAGRAASRGGRGADNLGDRLPSPHRGAPV